MDLLFWNLVALVLERDELKIIDTTKFAPVVIGGIKEKWLFRCDTCGYQAVFILWKGSGMSTGCERCPGSMERKKKLTKDDEILIGK